MPSDCGLPQKIIDWTRANGGKAVKLHGNQLVEAGTPDVLGSIVWGGISIPFLVEAKCPGEQPSRIQLQRIKEWDNAGMLCFWCRDLDGFINTITRHARNLNKART